MWACQHFPDLLIGKDFHIQNRSQAFSVTSYIKELRGVTIVYSEILHEIGEVSIHSHPYSRHRPPTEADMTVAERY